ncbi:hypothetical protein [Salinibacterium sp. ZJ77]|uniref:hypothetical protein n=1 Tax=Salinibacterium sp. ZJ77 TaxID=2708337 RepID=UPI0014222AD5|nr:hypothetical protein [Salinibacterium sp. ZJ77]
MTQSADAFPSPTWTPPAREPFVPLRPLTLGQILSGAVRALRTGGGTTLGPAIMLSVGATLAASLVSWLVVDPAVDALGASSGSVSLYHWLAGFGAGFISWIVLRSTVLAAGLAQQGVAASFVTHAVVGRRLTPGGLRRRTAGTWARQWAWVAICLAVLLVAGLIAASLIGAASLAGGPGAIAVTALVYVLGGVALAFAGTRLAFVPSVLAVERLPLVRAVRRSFALTRRAFWRTFGTRLLAWTMIWIAGMLITLPVVLLLQLLQTLLAGNGAVADLLAIEELGSFVLVVASAVIGAIGLVVTTSTDALLYLDLRMRREGLDLELARFLEVRRPGTRHDPTEPDPYLSPDALPAPASAETPW